MRPQSSSEPNAQVPLSNGGHLSFSAPEEQYLVVRAVRVRKQWQSHRSDRRKDSNLPQVIYRATTIEPGESIVHVAKRLLRKEWDNWRIVKAEAFVVTEAIAVELSPAVFEHRHVPGQSVPLVTTRNMRKSTGRPVGRPRKHPKTK